MMRWLLAAALISVASHGQTDRSFKAFYKEGKALFESREFDQALAKFKEAYRLEPTPQKIKIEGTFFEPYLPRHRIALCFEHIDILEADAWIEESLTALEMNTLKKRQVIAAYQRDVERIQTLAKQERRERDAAYRLALASAQNLLDAQRFDEAEKAFQQLYETDPDRVEAGAGLNNVGFARKAFIENKYMGIQMALAQGQVDQARALWERIEEVDPSHPDLDDYRTRIDAALPAKNTKTKLKQSPAAESGKLVAKSDQGQVAKPTPPPKQSIQQTPREDKQAVGKAVRRVLLASLVPYQHGNPDLALQRLEQDSIDGIEDWGSYHWLRGVYLATLYVYGDEADAEMRDDARAAMIRAVELSGDIKPDPDIYPEYVLELFAEVKGEMGP